MAEGRAVSANDTCPDAAGSVGGRRPEGTLGRGRCEKGLQAQKLDHARLKQGEPVERGR